MILKPKDVYVENIILKKNICCGNNIYNIPIKYLVNDLIIQTPIMFTPFGITKFNNKSYLDVSFLNLKIDKEMNELYTLINNINKHVCKIMKRKKDIKNTKDMKDKKEFINSIKPSNSIFPDRIRLNILDNIRVYNENKQLITFDYIQPKIYLKLLISPQNVWKNEINYGISWHILQVKVYSKTILDTYSFIDDDENNNKIKTHPKYSKYFKMISCGVPIDAVKQKMIMDNMDPSILDNNNSMNSSINNSINNNINNSINNSINNNINNSINNNINNSMINSINNSINKSINNSINNSIKNGIHNSIKNGINNGNNSLKTNSIANMIQLNKSNIISKIKSGVKLKKIDKSEINKNKYVHKQGHLNPLISLNEIINIKNRLKKVN